MPSIALEALWLSLYVDDSAAARSEARWGGSTHMNPSHGVHECARPPKEWKPGMHASHAYGSSKPPCVSTRAESRGQTAVNETAGNASLACTIASDVGVHVVRIRRMCASVCNAHGGRSGGGEGGGGDGGGSGTGGGCGDGACGGGTGGEVMVR